tara:strand:+ start:675 stop:1043 length:369 start_codon:yes stop_codon:yes gene_type:complete
MPLITLPFNFDINVSIQVGDMAYFVPTTTSASFDINSSAVIQIGPVTAINSTSMPRTITCNTNLVPGTPPYPYTGDFILFSKDNKANLSSMLGYYAEVKMANDSKDKAELFRVSADYSESSK